MAYVLNNALVLAFQSYLRRGSGEERTLASSLFLCFGGFPWR